MKCHSKSIVKGFGQIYISPSVRLVQYILNIYWDKIHRTDGRKYIISFGQLKLILIIIVYERQN